MPAVWTDENEVVRRIVYDDEQADADAFIVSEDAIPSRNPSNPWCEVTIHYNDTDGFYTTEEDPFDGLNLSDSEKQELYDAVQENDLVKARNLIEQYL